MFYLHFNINNLHYEYFMTRRMNQDAIEHFFGEVRQACGCNTHPDPLQFIQVYRLLSVASLVKPPRGSYITGGEMLNSLLNASDLISETAKQRQVKFEKELDELLDNGEPVESLISLFDHSYHEINKIDEKALRMFCGYVARKARKATDAKHCDQCFGLLQADQICDKNENNSYINKRNDGHLLTPSEGLYEIIYNLESSICHTLQHTPLGDNILFEVIKNAKLNTYKPVGCELHKRKLTKDLLRFYLTTRMIFTCKQYNKRRLEDADKRKKIKDSIKKFKIV
uniref:Transposable element P transposase-like RNase H C-terminal domain-containing protein n=1 Tax=Photinus pyralis TaxID=7054 RepID=A0A1Y1LMH4_PHOPY